MPTVSIKQKETIVKRFLEGKSPREVATELHLGQSTVRNIRDQHLQIGSGNQRVLKSTQPLSDIKGRSHSEALDMIVNRFMPFHHKAHQKTTAAVMHAAIDAGRIRPTDMARSMSVSTSTNPGSALSRIREWTKNDKIDVEPIPRHLFRQLTEGTSNVVMTVDWSDFSPNPHITFQVALVTSRCMAVPIICKTRPKSTLGVEWKKADVYREVFEILHEARAEAPWIDRVIILGDREFGTVPFLKLCTEFGFDYCLRKHGGAGWSKEAKQYSVQDVAAGCPPTRLRDARYTAQRYKVRSIAWTWEAGMKAPWILLSSLDISARQLVTLYGLRWSIETNFKADKDENTGMGFGKTYLYGDVDVACERRDRLWIIVAFINVYYLALGVASELLALDHQFVVDKSERRHPEMSLRRKGKEMHKVWKGSVMREATGVPPKNRPSRSASDVRAYTRRHADDVIEAFELSLHVLRHWSTFFTVEGHWLLFESDLRRLWP